MDGYNNVKTFSVKQTLHLQRDRGAAQHVLML